MAERIESAVTGRSFQSFIALQVNHTMSMLPGKPVTSSEGVLWEDEGSLRVCVSAILIRVSSLLWARALQIDKPSAHEAANKPTIVSCCLAYAIVPTLSKIDGKKFGPIFLETVMDAFAADLDQLMQVRATGQCAHDDYILILLL